MLELLTPPAHVAFSTLARVKAELGLSATVEDDARDAWIVDRICDASSLIETELGRPIARRRVRERFSGNGRMLALLTITPVRAIEAVTHDTLGPIDLSLGDVRISDPDAGFLWCRQGWPDDSPVSAGLTYDPQPQVGEQPWQTTYLGGWLTVADDVRGDGITCSGHDFIFPAGKPVPLLVSGEDVASRGWLNAGNNRRFKVINRSDTVLTIDGTLTVEIGVGAGPQILVRNLPATFERLVMDTVRMWYFARQTQRDPSIKSESLGDWSASYAIPGENGSVLPASVLKGLEQFRRLA